MRLLRRTLVSALNKVRWQRRRSPALLEETMSNGTPIKRNDALLDAQGRRVVEAHGTIIPTFSTARRRFDLAATRLWPGAPSPERPFIRKSSLIWPPRSEQQEQHGHAASDDVGDDWETETAGSGGTADVHDESEAASGPARKLQSVRPPAPSSASLKLTFPCYDTL